MNDYIDQVVQAYQGHGTACIGGAWVGNNDERVQEAARAVLKCLAGLNYNQANAAINLASQALGLAASLPR